MRNKKIITEEQKVFVDNAEVIIKQKRKIDTYDSFSNNPAEHLIRHGWDKGFDLKWPSDVGLEIESSIDRNELLSQFQEIYMRFLNMGLINEFGTHCILMSSILRRILRLHGYNAYMRQVICYWENEERGYRSVIGVPDRRGNGETTIEGSIDAHVVVACEGYILDFTLSHLQNKYGSCAPRALIGIDQESDEYQDFGVLGIAAWTDVKPVTPIIKHWRFEQKPIEMDITRQYFRLYQF